MTPAIATAAALTLRSRRVRRAECDLPAAEGRSGSVGPRVADSAAPTLFDEIAAEPARDPGDEPTLEALVSGVWEGLVTHQQERCPLCGGELAAVYGVHSRPVAGRCRDCETTLD